MPSGSNTGWIGSSVLLFNSNLPHHSLTERLLSPLYSWGIEDAERSLDSLEVINCLVLELELELRSVWFQDLGFSHCPTSWLVPETAYLSQEKALVIKARGWEQQGEASPCCYSQHLTHRCTHTSVPESPLKQPEVSPVATLGPETVSVEGFFL